MFSRATSLEGRSRHIEHENCAQEPVETFVENDMKTDTVRTLTKVGMVGAMAVLALPAFQQASPSGGQHRRRSNSALHTWAGIALVGFAVWHYNCYQPAVRTRD